MSWSISLWEVQLPGAMSGEREREAQEEQIRSPGKGAAGQTLLPAGSASEGWMPCPSYCSQNDKQPHRRQNWEYGRDFFSLLR